MRIDPGLCASCGICLIYCPLGTIHMDDIAEVNQEVCAVLASAILTTAKNS